ncbi:copper fist DNA binding domain-containing protein [Halteromyces radiatus]|uniref:copper fist DNA binding domain-containing protein n=1 Tax=Halteromyces radiatus TaxID=101107 RepID=UPI00221F7114|nr:copper fist DNA binding domain-containing protein [Halteromyces radiatus]KAI8079766.1 copper fist DNA binding domain-containing protein [Halteromyces radiatus]
MAIEKEGVKYACISCIRGHRVKKCQHLDRKLIPVLKRGRQVSQCTHCRDLRSSGSHVKCTCAIATGNKEGEKKIFFHL